MERNGVNAIPFDHPHLDRWRDALRAGVEYHDQDSNLMITGGIDDVWVDNQEQLMVVDYKETTTMHYYWPWPSTCAK